MQNGISFLSGIRLLSARKITIYREEFFNKSCSSDYFSHNCLQISCRYESYWSNGSSRKLLYKIDLNPLTVCINSVVN